MTDIVERLRLSVTKGHEPTDELAVEAADEIERLRQRIATEREGSDTWDQAQDSEVRRLRAEVELWKERYNDLLRDADNGYSL